MSEAIASWPTAALLVASLAGCSGLAPRIGDRDEQPDGRTPDPTSADAPPQHSGGLEDEEEIHENPDALAALISRLTQPESPQGAAPEPADDTPTDAAAGALAPAAFESWQLSDAQCLARLERAGVRTSRPKLETPMVRTPLLLEGPIDGVSVRPRWPRPDRVNAVMDCRLVLALVEVARQARRLGVTELLFYSTYRPLKQPPAKCPAGRKGNACRKAQRKYQQALTKKHSQHRRALAIDIRWLVTDDGETLDVLEHYERRDKQPPCDDQPRSDEGKLLQEFACALHQTRVFNVMLTPNANKAHHNHFHFDITPDAKWYVIH